MSGVRALARGVDGLLTRPVLLAGAVLAVSLGVIALVLNVVLGHYPQTWVGTAIAPDYLAHWTGGRLLLEGRTGVLYDRDAQHGLQRALTGGQSGVAWFVGPPLSALAYAPLALLPYVASAAVWTVVSVVLLVASMLLLRPMLARLGGRDYPLVVLAVAATQPVLDLVGIGQDSALSLLLWVSGIRLLRAGRDGWAGAVLALGLVKPQLFALVPLVLLAQRRWRALAAWSAAASALLVASSLLVGPSVLPDWLGTLGSAQYQDLVQSTQAWMMQGVPSLLLAVTPLSVSGVAQVVGYLVAAGLVLAVLGAAWRSPRAVVPIWALTCLTAVVSSPHVLGYDLVVALPALLILLDRHDRTLVRLSLVALVVLSWTGWPRHAIAGGWPWPASALAASWCTVPLVVLWWVLWRDSVAADAEPGDPVPLALADGRR
jgi:Glycosyltransferase family 87